MSFDLRGQTALVTGAASGIGAALAGVLAARGCNLALADVDQAGLATVAAAVSGVTVSTHRLDVADKAAAAALPAAVLAAHPGVSVLVNNAGVALGGTFEQVSEADFDWLLDINFNGLVRMTRAFLPVLRRAPEGRIVNVSSIFGIVAPPGQTAYAASKFAVRGFSEALRHELDGSGVGVTVVHPGGVKTAIASNARRQPMPDSEAEQLRAQWERRLTLSPGDAAEQIAAAIEARAPRLLIGQDARRVALIQRLFPVGYWRVVARLSK